MTFQSILYHCNVVVFYVSIGKNCTFEWISLIVFPVPRGINYFTKEFKSKTRRTGNYFQQ